MKCRFVVTPEQHKSGRAILRCERSGCNISGLMPLSGNPKDLSADCNGLPFPDEWGHWLAIFSEAMGVTKGRYIAAKAAIGLNPSCGCDRRESSYNALGARFAAFVRWLRGS